jgi:molybdate-binding protein
MLNMISENHDFVIPKKDIMAASQLQEKIKSDLLKSLKHLKYSYDKVKNIDLTKKDWSENELEVLESFSSRFARTTDIFVSRFLRLKVHEWDPAFRGSMIDLLLIAEKQGLIASAKKWYRIRELRNAAAHEYTSDDLQILYTEIYELSSDVLDLKEQL